jgi:imidazoleglycerol-phosphate dehydratase
MKAKGDLEVDQHHLVEDCGIVLGKAFKKALGDKKGINRTGYFVYPMDEALAIVAVDISGRPYLQFDVKFKRRFCGDLDTDLLEDFFQAFATGLEANIVVRMPYGRSDHHKIEAIFKALGKAMKMACSKDKRAIENIPSTKGKIGDDSDN